MRLRVLGSAIAGTSLHRREAFVPTMGYLLESGEDHLLLECGPGAVMAVGTLMPLHDLAGVLVSHMHFDNCFDLVPLAVGAFMDDLEPLSGIFVGDHRAIPIWLPCGGARYLRDLLATALRYAPLNLASVLAERVVVREFVPGESCAIGTFTITALGPVVHGPGPCLGFRITDVAATVGYSGESGICDAQYAIAHDVDLYLCDAMMATDDIMGIQTSRHMSAQSAGKIARSAGARQLVLTHMLSQSDEWCDLLQSVARRECNIPVSIARVDAEFDVPHR